MNKTNEQIKQEVQKATSLIDDMIVVYKLGYNAGIKKAIEEMKKGLEK